MMVVLRFTGGYRGPAAVSIRHGFVGRLNCGSLADGFGHREGRTRPRLVTILKVLLSLRGCLLLLRGAL